ncbi:hypothetical protein AURDEDRAFT_144233 [Auricularia subglabra TFB-10046 SS5]|nr:hypothetical protein AURDEDRAFT_144233 [Auricularia subglabra TFB-10046 SS5]
MMEDLAAAEREKERVSKELEEERRLRARDGDVYKERLAGVETGVEKIVQELEDRLEAAEKEVTAAQRAQKAVEAEREAERARADRAERRLVMQSQDQGADAAEMAAAQDRVAELTQELTSVKNDLKRTEDDRDAARKDAEAAKAQARALERKVRDAQDEGLGKDQDLRISKTLAIELQQTVGTLQAEAERLRDEVEIDKQHIKDLEHDYTAAFQEAERLKMQMETMRAAAVQSEAALEEAERQMTDDAGTIVQLRAQVADLQHSVHESSLASRRGVDASAGRSTILPDGSVYAEEVEALRADLDAAHAEIGRLKYMYGQTPVRSAITKAKDARLDELERRNEQLEDELAELQRFVAGADALSKANISIGKPETPLAFKQTMHRINSLVRTPKTPGAPLRDPSWAMTTPGKTGQDSLLVNIALIQRQLNRAEADLGAVNAEEEDRWGLAHLSAAELRRRPKPRKPRRPRVPSVQSAKMLETSTLA